MRIQGLQKLTLLDYPGKTACTVFTAGCNFRCPFCHNASLVVGEPNVLVPEEEFFAFLRRRRSKLDGVCVTGGEPLLQRDIISFIEKIKALGFLVKLDTNGSRPETLSELTDRKLIDYVAMDIKNAPAKYALTIGRKQYDMTPVLESAALLLSDVVPYEFRTTVVKELHQEADFYEIAQWIAGAKKYYLQAFVDSGDLLEEGLSSCSRAEMEQFLAIVRRTIPQAALRGL